MRHLGRTRAAVRTIVVALIGASASCRNAANADGSRACQQTYEFGNTGCFELAGRVVGLRGQALAGMSVGPRPVSGPHLFNADYRTTDEAGHFRIRLSRMVGSPPASPARDTLSVYVVAADPRSAGLGTPATIRDSVLTLVTVAPIGTLPEPAEVRIVLPVP
jgi:hypothetical protein